MDKLFGFLKFHSQSTDSSESNNALCQDDQSYRLAVASVIKMIHLIHVAGLQNHHEVGDGLFGLF